MDGDVERYLETLDDARRATVAGLYAHALALVPEAEEGTKYAMPALLYKGRGLLSVVATASHVGIYPFSGTALDLVRGRLAEAGIAATRGAVQLPYGTWLPDGMLEQIVLARRAELDR